MMNKRDNHPHDFEFLRPLKERPDLQPDHDFVRNVRRVILNQPPKKQSWLSNLLPYTIGLFAVVTFSILATFFIKGDFLGDDGNKLGDPVIPIEDNEDKENNDADIPNTKPAMLVEEVEEARLVLELQYGTKDGDIGKRTDYVGGRSAGIRSFYVRDDLFYIVDNENHNIVITDREGNVSTIALGENVEGSAIYVDGQKNVYVLLYDAVNKYDAEGQLQKTYPVNLQLPDKIRENEDGVVFVQQAGGYSMILETGEKVSLNAVLKEEVEVKRVSETLGKLMFEEGGQKREIDVEFEESFGELTVHDVNKEQIVLTKTEVAANISRIMIERHMYVLDKKNGKVLGAVRVPTEKMREAPNHLLQFADNKMYFLSPEEEGVRIYELIPGKQFEKKLQDRITKFLEEEQSEK